jgi:hypothetical protein
MCDLINKKKLLLKIITNIVQKIINIWKGVEEGSVSYNCTLKNV